MEYESNQWYEFYYHYMHDNPSCIVIVQTRGCLLERTLELIKQDPMVVIHDIKKTER